MTAALWLFIRPFALKLALGGAIILTVLAVMARLKHAGKTQERVETMARTIKAIKRQEIEKHDRIVKGRKSGKSAADRLRESWSRD